jgi:hypothetical protein
MRIFSFIFSVYLLLLSVQPCQDFAASEFSYSQSGNEQTRVNDDEDEQQETHECSPFCICSCRQMSVAYNLSTPAQEKETVIFTQRCSKITSQKLIYSNHYLDSIWQPPKYNFTA